MNCTIGDLKLPCTQLREYISIFWIHCKLQTWTSNFTLNFLQSITSTLILYLFCSWITLFMLNSEYWFGFFFTSSKNSLVSYWTTATPSQLEEEFAGQREIISKFANINKDDISGARTPFLQLAGNNSFEAYINAGLKYDNSWPSLTARKLFPYTLDHVSNQQCLVGKCPKETFPGFFVVPISNIIGFQGKQCNALLACEVEWVI